MQPLSGVDRADLAYRTLAESLGLPVEDSTELANCIQGWLTQKLASQPGAGGQASSTSQAPAAAAAVQVAVHSQAAYSQAAAQAGSAEPADEDEDARMGKAKDRVHVQSEKNK